MTTGDVLSALARVACGEPAFAVIGAVARNAWAPPRATTDLDLAVAARVEVLAAFERALEVLGYRCVRRHQVEPADALPDLVVFRSEAGEPVQIDLLVAKTSFEESVLARATALAVAGTAVPVATCEDLVVYKLLADRPRDRDDIDAVLRTQRRAARSIDWSYVEGWCASWGIADRVARARSGSEAAPEV